MDNETEDAGILDASDISLQGVELYPVLDNVSPLCRTGNVTVKRTKGGQRRLVIPLILEEPSKSAAGADLEVGRSITVGIMMEPSGGMTAERCAEELAKFQVAVLKLDRPAANFGNIEQYRNQLVRPTFKAQKNDPTRQDIARWGKA